MSSTSAPGPHSRRDPGLDGLRGFAVLMVYVWHYGGGLKSTHPALRILGYLTQTGWIGVILFFALSGFLITGSLWDSFSQPHWLSHFYARRALRIFPLYYAVLFAVVVIALASGASFHLLRPIAIYFVFAQDLPHLTDRISVLITVLPLYHLWSLAVEEQFYLIWPALLFFAYRNPANRLRRALNLCLAIFLIAEIFRILAYGFRVFGEPTLWDSFLLTHAGALALGAALALALRGKHWPRLQQLALPTFLLSLAAYLVSSFLGRSLLPDGRLQFLLGLPALNIACAAAIPILLRPGLLRCLASFTPLAWLGRISYGFYVFHILLQPLFDKLATHYTHTTYGTPYQAARFFVAFPITLLVSWLSYEFFELPLLDLNRHFQLHQALPDSATASSANPARSSF